MQNQSQSGSYDLIIVGAGTAGSIIAARLAEHGVRARDGEPLKIALLEAGPYLKGKLNPGHGVPSRRSRFTNVSHNLSGSWVWRWTEAANLVCGCTLIWGIIGYLAYEMV